MAGSTTDAGILSVQALYHTRTYNQITMAPTCCRLFHMALLIRHIYAGLESVSQSMCLKVCAFDSGSLAACACCAMLTLIQTAALTCLINEPPCDPAVSAVTAWGWRLGFARIAREISKGANESLHSRSSRYNLPNSLAKALAAYNKGVCLAYRLAANKLQL